MGNRKETFGEYLQRQGYKRKNLFKGITKPTYYRRIKHPTELTIAELRWLITVADVDIERITEFIESGDTKWKQIIY